MEQKTILIVDDSVFFCVQLSRILHDAGYEVLTASTGDEALKSVHIDRPDLVLMNVEMPGMNGIEVCRTLRSSENNSLMPIIMLTSRDVQEDKLVALEMGADDYILKPFNERELLARIRNTLVRIARNRAAHPLTGLPGILEYQRELEHRIAGAEKYATIVADIDNFKPYNDAYGFSKGDIVIRLASSTLTEQVYLYGNPEDFIGHIGSDDFVVVTTPDKAEAIIDAFIHSFDERIGSLFSPEDRKAGFFSVKNRKGKIETYPILSVSVALVTNTRRYFHTPVEVSTVASEVITKLKEMPGSNSLADRRTEG